MAQDICLPVGDGVVNVRVGAIIEKNGRLLMVRSDSLDYNGQYLLMILYMVTVIFSRAGILGSSDLLYHSRLFVYLGSLSVPMFFFQNIFRNLLTMLFKDITIVPAVLFVYLDTILLSAIINLLIKRPGKVKA